MIKAKLYVFFSSFINIINIGKAIFEESGFRFQVDSNIIHNRRCMEKSMMEVKV